MGRLDSSDRHFVMTVDVDGWSSLLRFYDVDHDPSQVDAQVKVSEDGVPRLLDLFKKHDILVTFFVTGWMAQRHPDMVKRILRQGHEVACHGLLHLKDEYVASKAEQESRLREATSIIERISGTKPLGFRAPCLRVNRDTFELLAKNGYLYDSSIIPTFIPRYYGNFNLNFKPYWLPLTACNSDSKSALLEIPVSVNPLLLIPLSAAWMRNLGEKWVKSGIWLNFGLHNSVTLYVHPRDVLSLPRVKGVPWHLYRNAGSSLVEILDKVLEYARSLDASFTRAIDLALTLRAANEGKL